MSKTSLVSVILPTFNVEKKVALSLASVLEAQAPFEAVEVLVMDGASTDGTLAIAREWAARDARIQVFSAPDAGLYDAMNRGIAQSRGEMLYFLGAGDLLRPGTLAALQAQPDLHPKLLLHGQVWHEGSNLAPGAGAGLGPIDLARYNIPHQGAFYGRGVFETVGNYCLDYRIYADHELNWRCWTHSQIETRFWPHIVADFEAGGLSSSRHDPNFARDWPRHVWRRGGLWPWAAYQLSSRFSVEQLALLQRVRARLRSRLRGRAA